MTSHTKINVYALENYVIAATAVFGGDDHQQTANIDVSLVDANNQKALNKKGGISSTNNNTRADVINDTNNRSKVSAKNKRGRESEKQQEEEEQKHTLINCKTPLEKLISLKIRYTRQNSCVLSVEGVLLVHAHRHTHILLLKQHVQKRKNVANRASTKSGSDVNISSTFAVNKSDERSAHNATAASSVITRETAYAAAALSSLSTASSVANVQNDVVFRLPGGRCRRGESEENCLIRKLGRLLLNEAKLSSLGNSNNDNNKISGNINVGSTTSNTTMMNGKSTTEMTGVMSAGGSAGGHVPETILDVNAENENEHQSQAASFFHVGELLAKWYRPHFSPLMYPYIPPHISPTSIKEMRSVFLVQVEPMMYFNVVQCMDAELVAVPLFDLYDNSAKYGPVISALPSQLSRVLVEYCNVEY